MGRIVVGVDESDNARAALAWAMAEARLRDDQLEAVTAWHEPYLGGTAMVPLPIDPDSLEESHRNRLEIIIAEVRGDDPGPAVEATLVRGTATAALLEVSKGADLLVVGSRGQGGFLGLLLGSVTQQVVSHAPCPVVVVPAG
jgi:nucleotide-binding universal stress UspA family protein